MTFMGIVPWMAETASPFWNVCVSCLDLLCTDSSLKVKTYNGGAPVWPLSSHRTAFLACAYETCLSDLYPFVKFGWNYRRTKKLGEIDENKWRQTRWAHPFFGPWKSWLHFSSDCSFLLVSHSLLSIKLSSIPVLAPMLVNHVPNLAFPLTTIDT